jgi:hypothetical protein
MFPLNCATFAWWVILLPAYVSSFHGPQFTWVRIFLKTFSLNRATAAQRDAFLEAAANFLQDPRSPQVSSFGFPRHPAADAGPSAASSLVPKISLQPLL